jgi:hypothetical protein
MRRWSAGFVKKSCRGHQECLRDPSKGIPADAILGRIKARHASCKKQWDFVRVIFTPLAERHINSLHEYIKSSTPESFRGSCSCGLFPWVTLLRSAFSG